MPVYDEASSLFEIDPPAQSANILAPLPIKPEQIQMIREAFEKAGVVGQDERKALIESVLLREVASLRELKAVEARRILQRIERCIVASQKALDRRGITAKKILGSTSSSEPHPGD